MPSVVLQPGETERFRETQRLAQNRVVAVIIPMEMILMTGLFLVLGLRGPPADRVTLAVAWMACAVLIPGLILAMGFTTVVTDRRLIVRWFPPLPGRSVPVDELRAADVVVYNPMGDAGGWGWRMSAKYHRVFNVWGDRGVHVRTGEATRDQFLIGSQRPEELAAALRAARHRG